MGKKENRDRNRAGIGYSVTGFGMNIGVPPVLSPHAIIKGTNEFVKQALSENKRKAVGKTADASTVLDPALAKVFASIATNVWRSKRRIVDPATGEPREEMKRLYRHIEAIHDALCQADVQTLDLTGRTYDTGMALKVVSFEPTPGLQKEEIKETVTPSVLWHGRLIQMGEVIVGTPQLKDSDKENKQ